MVKRKLALSFLFLSIFNLAHAESLHLQNWPRTGYGSGLYGRIASAEFFTGSFNSAPTALYNGENETFTFPPVISRGKISEGYNVVGTTQLNMPQIIVHTRTASNGQITFLPTNVRFSLTLYKGRQTEIIELVGTAVVINSQSGCILSISPNVSSSDILGLGSKYENSGGRLDNRRYFSRP